MKRFLNISVIFGVIVLAGSIVVTAKNRHAIAYDIYEEELKCVANLIDSGVQRKNIKILNGTGTCKNLISGDVQ